LRGRVEGLTVGLVGDIAHRRVARSNIHGLTTLGAKVLVCGPPTLVPACVARLGVEVAHKLDDILQRCDVLNLLRVQFERQRAGLTDSLPRTTGRPWPSDPASGSVRLRSSWPRSWARVPTPTPGGWKSPAW